MELPAKVHVISFVLPLLSQDQIKPMLAPELLDSLADEYWQTTMVNQPLNATSLGDRRFDDRLADITPSGRERELKQYQTLLERVEKIPEQELTAEQMITRKALIVELRQQFDYLSCGLEDWSVDPLAGPQVEFLNVESYQPLRNFSEAIAMVRRWSARDFSAKWRNGLSLRGL
jgi:uncharacterized protein (DUF885 family)